MTFMSNYLEKHPEAIKRVLGINSFQLQQLLTQAKLRHEQKLAEIEKKKVRLIAGGGGRKRKLTIEDEIILTLAYLRHFSTFQFLGMLFEVSETTANDIFNYWLKILEELLPCSLLEQLKLNQSETEIVKEILAEFQLLVDSSEQGRERPGDYEEQKKFCSGKKKKHPFKNQFIVLPDGRDLVDVTAGIPGPSSDINLFRSRQKRFDSRQKFRGDKAYKGEQLVDTPQKKPKNSELTAEQKQSNREQAKHRIVVEHVIRLVKIFRVASERFRLRPQVYERVIFTVCGLIRLRIGALVLPV